VGEKREEREIEIETERERRGRVAFPLLWMC
jgi:hypothetical protein